MEKFYISTGHCYYGDILWGEYGLIFLIIGAEWWVITVNNPLCTHIFLNFDFSRNSRPSTWECIDLS